MIELRVPGDKSIAHRALILSSLARGDSRITNLPDGADVASTLAMMRAFGVDVARDGDAAVVRGAGVDGLRAPAAPIDCGNSGTTARLGIGLAAGLTASATFDGDASLRRRPMERVVEPLRAMGAQVEYLAEHGRLPLRVTGGRLGACTFRNEVASAQVKSAILIAALASGVSAEIVEPTPTRDHTERMLRAMGAELLSDGSRIAYSPGALRPLDLAVPGDFSSAAFLIAAALLGRVPLVLRDVGVNTTRTGFLDVVRRMGGAVTVDAQREVGGEPVADLEARPSSLRGTTVSGAEVVRAIDELPLVAVLGARAAGETVVRDAAELRAKESDRIHALVTNLAALGVDVEERADGFVVRGSDSPIAGRAASFGDHRIAMAFAVLGTAPASDVAVDDLDVARVSYPGFAAQLAQLRAASTSSFGGAA
ncbi:MAG TPA: 3-phosphoshikimate 1-carboxyvinyltransferase [Longimicrobiales bacterium]